MGKRYIPRHVKPRAKKNRAGVAMAALAVSFVLLLVLISTVIGKYQHQLDSDGYVRALEFYFTSDFLDGKTHRLAPGSTEVSFTLGNHADELRYSEMDITYDVTVEPVGATTSESLTVEQGSGTLVGNKKDDINVTIKGLKSGSYTVTAVGKGGYSKTLKATIVVPAQSAQLYEYQEKVTGEYILLTVWNEGDEAGNVTISYTGIPDNTNPNMTAWTTNGSQKVTIAPHESKVFRFFTGEVTVTGATRKVPS